MKRKIVAYLLVLALALIFIFKDTGVNSLSILALITYIGILIIMYLKRRGEIDIPLS